MINSTQQNIVKSSAFNKDTIKYLIQKYGEP